MPAPEGQSCKTCLCVEQLRPGDEDWSRCLAGQPGHAGDTWPRVQMKNWCGMWTPLTGPAASGVPFTVVLSVPAAGPFPVPVVGPSYGVFVDWADVAISDGRAFSYANGVLTAGRAMTLVFGATLNFAATDTQLVQARIKVSSSAVDFSGCDEGTGSKDAITLFGVITVAAGDTVAVELRDEGGAGAIVMEDCALSIYGLI